MIIEQILLLKMSVIQTSGYFLIFLTTFLEAFPLIGIFIPGGSVILFFAGFLAKLGFINTTMVLVSASLGAILGDLFGYLFGRYKGKEFLHKYGKYFLVKREYIDKAGYVVCGNTGKALVLGRLNPITRAVTPFIAGSHDVKFGKFMFFNIIGGIFWALVFVSLGYVFGANYRIAAGIDRILLWSSLAGIFLIYAYYSLRYFFSRKRECKDIKMRGNFK